MDTIHRTGRPLDSNTRRRFVRLKTRQAARVRFASGMTLDCEIRDFCPTGLFLRFPPGNASAAVGPSLVEASVVVEFGVGAAPGRHAVEGRVAHHSDAGIGVFSSGMTEPAFQALLEYRAGLYQAAGDVQRRELDAADPETVRRQCQSLYRPFLARVIDELFRLADAEATADPRADVPFGDAAALHALCMALRRSRTDIEQRFSRAALGRVEGTAAPEIANTGAGQSLELSLVDDGEFDDWLNLSAVISKVESGLDKPLARFESLYRLAAARTVGNGVDGAPEGAADQSSPFGPDALCRAFQESIQDLPVDNALRAMLYRLFGRALTVHAPVFYEGLAKVAAVAERRQVRSEGTVGNPVRMPSVNRAAAPGAPAAGPATAGIAEGSLVRTASLLRQVVSQLADVAPTGDAPRAPVPAATPADLPAADARELLLAVQGLLQARAGEPAALGQGSLTDQLRSRLAGSDGKGRIIAPRDREILDTLANLFDKVMGEYAPGSELASLMRRFEEPFYRLALRDPDFLNSDQHPARELLDVLDQFAIATDDQGRFFDSKLFKALGGLVDNVVAGSEQNPGLYGQSVQTLRKMLVPLQKERRQRILRLQEACEGRHRILQSRHRVLSELESRLGGRRVPRLLLRLLEQGWRHHLCLVELRQGNGSDEWLVGIGIVDTLLEWLAPDFRPAGAYTAGVASVMRAIRSGLAGVSVEPQTLDALLEDLDRALLGRMREPDREVEFVALAPGRILPGHDKDGAAPAGDARLGERLVLGSWWNIAPDGDRATAQQLIWLSQPPGRCAFANRSATQKQEFPLAELDRLRASGRAESGPDKELPVLERSEGLLVDSVYRHLTLQSRHDPVTHLINRRTLLHRLGELPAEPVGTARPHTLGIIEFDQLRIISHLHGVEVREGLLRQLAAEFEQRLQPDAVLAAFGDDTFGAWLPGCDAGEARERFSGAITWLKDFRYTRDGASFGIAASVGVVEFHPGTLEAGEILRRADAACMSASTTGGNQIQFYSRDDVQVQGQETLLEWAGSIDTILAENRLFLRCQRVSPVTQATGLESYYEILLGVRDSRGVVTGPLPLIQAAERWNRIHEIDRWVLEQVFAWIRTHRGTFDALGGFSVNLSPQSLRNEDILTLLHRELASLDLPATKLMFEITETASVGSYAPARDFIQQIRRYGCRFCIDDFGSGYASYGHLKNLQADVLKIDGIFVKDMLTSAADRAMVGSMKEIGHSLGMTVVAEYVATEQHLSAVREIGVDYAQGYALHEPVPLDELVPGGLAPALPPGSRPPLPGAGMVH
ncbi:MAG: DUF1631 family protein [Pseudomonadales bacterium]|nr:DUF1631 family protein [Pseudomonadales bacterium]